MDNYLLRHRLHKMFLLVSILGLLLVSNSVAAGYADEYRAKHPRRVKTTKDYCQPKCKRAIFW